MTRTVILTLAVVLALFSGSALAGRNPNKPTFLDVRLPSVIAASVSSPRIVKHGEIAQAVLEYVVERAQHPNPSSDPEDDLRFRIGCVIDGTSENPIQSVQVPVTVQVLETTDLEGNTNIKNVPESIAQYLSKTERRGFLVQYQLRADYSGRISNLRGQAVLFISYAQEQFTDLDELFATAGKLYTVNVFSERDDPFLYVSKTSHSNHYSSVTRAYKTGFDVVTFCALAPEFIQGVTINPVTLAYGAAKLWSPSANAEQLQELANQMRGLEKLDKMDFSRYGHPNFFHNKTNGLVTREFVVSTGDGATKMLRLAVIDYKTTTPDRAATLCYEYGIEYSMNKEVVIGLQPHPEVFLKFNSAKSFSGIGKEVPYPHFVIKTGSFVKLTKDLHLGEVPESDQALLDDPPKKAHK